MATAEKHKQRSRRSYQKSMSGFSSFAVKSTQRAKAKAVQKQNRQNFLQKLIRNSREKGQKQEG